MLSDADKFWFFQSRDNSLDLFLLSIPCVEFHDLADASSFDRTLRVEFLNLEFIIFLALVEGSVGDLDHSLGHFNRVKVQ